MKGTASLLNHIWSPWRMEYIERTRRPAGCIFCEALEQEDSPENLVLIRGQAAFIILNRYPYTSGHLMVVPFLHTPSLEELAPAIRAEMMELATRAVTVLRTAYQPEAFNVGINIGAAAGAGVASHVHIHVVPRWAGDTNFMSTLAATRVLPENLADTYHRLQRVWAETE